MQLMTRAFVFQWQNGCKHHQMGAKVGAHCWGFSGNIILQVCSSCDSRIHSEVQYPLLSYVTVDAYLIVAIDICIYLLEECLLGIV